MENPRRQPAQPPSAGPRLTVSETALPGVLIIDPVVIADERGTFHETYRADRYAAAGIGSVFVQDNVSVSNRNVIRGLHFQNPHGQDKLISVVRGEVVDVAVDIRIGSPTRGQWVATILSAENHRQLFIPAGFAHGFAAVSDHTVVVYKCSDYYAPASEQCIRWDDDELSIHWPTSAPIVSTKDRAAPRLRDLSPDQCPRLQMPGTVDTT